MRNATQLLSLCPLLLAVACGGTPQGTLTPAEVERRASSWDAESRDEWQRPDELVRLLHLAEGMTVVDLGAGTGYMLPHLSRAVGSNGRVIALEAEPLLVEHLRQRVEQEQLSNVSVRLVERDDPMLEPGEVDRILFLDSWTEIEDRRHYARHLLPALRDGGRVMVVDVTEDAPHGPPEGQRMLAHEAVSELHSGRLHGEELDSPFPYQWVVVAGSAADALSRSADRELADETHADEPTSAAEATDGAADSANGSDAPEDAASTEE